MQKIYRRLKIPVVLMLSINLQPVGNSDFLYQSAGDSQRLHVQWIILALSERKLLFSWLHENILHGSNTCWAVQHMETTVHFLLHCNKYEKERKDMFDFKYHSGITTKQNKSSIITAALLLSPSVDKSVNSRYNRIVKEVLFEFLDKVNRAI